MMKRPRQKVITTAHPRSRALYGLAVIAVILAGLASRRYIALLPGAFGKYPGDALWAMMVFLGWGLLLPRISTVRVVLLSAATCALIETLKLYQAPWIVELRHTTLGHLVFGHVFSIENLVAYAISIALAAGLEGVLRQDATATSSTFSFKP